MLQAKWFSTFDLLSAYHQVVVEEKDSDNTAFIATEGCADPVPCLSDCAMQELLSRG